MNEFLCNNSSMLGLKVCNKFLLKKTFSAQKSVFVLSCSVSVKSSGD